MDIDKLLFESSQREVTQKLVQAIRCIDSDQQSAAILTEIERSFKKTFLDQKQDNFDKTSAVNWATVPNLYNKTDLEAFWNNLEKIDNDPLTKDTLFKVISEAECEYIIGLDITMNRDDLLSLVRENGNKPFLAAATTRRRKFADEKRNLDTADKKIIWESSLENLKKFFTTHRYTQEMMHRAIVEIAVESLPDFSDYFKTLTIQQLSDHLSSLDPVRHEKEMYLKPLKNIKREAHSTIEASFNTALTLYKLYIDKPNASFDQNSSDFDQQFYQFAVDALTRLTAPETSAKLRQFIHKCKHEGKTFTFKQLVTVTSAIEEETGYPTKPLHLNFMSPDALSVKLHHMHVSPQTTDTKNVYYNTQSDSSSDDEENRPAVKRKSSKRVSAAAPIGQPIQTVAAPAPAPTFQGQPAHVNAAQTQAMQTPPPRPASPIKELAFRQISEYIFSPIDPSLNNKEILEDDCHQLSCLPKYKVFKMALIQTITDIRNSRHETETYKCFIERLKDLNFSKRHIAAILYDERILDAISFSPSTSRTARHAAVMRHYENIGPNTRSTTAEVFHLGFSNYNRNAIDLTRNINDEAPHRSQNYNMYDRYESRSPNRYYNRQGDDRNYRRYDRSNSRDYRNNYYDRSSSRPRNYRDRRDDRSISRSRNYRRDISRDRRQRSKSFNRRDDRYNSNFRRDSRSSKRHQSDYYNRNRSQSNNDNKNRLPSSD